MVELSVSDVPNSDRYRPDASSKPEGPKELLPGEGILLQVARPRDAFLASGRLGREEPGVGLEPHAPQVQAVGVPAHPDALILAEFAVGVFLAGERQQVHLLVTEIERAAAQLPGQDSCPRTVHGVDAVVDPHGIVEEGEQEYERRVGFGRLGQEGEACRAYPFPVVLAVYGRIFARGSLEDGVNESCGVRYGDARVRTHAN